MRVIAKGVFKAAFLRWWLFFTILIVTGVFSWKIGLFQEIYENDTTPISMTILAMFVFMSCWCGYKTWKASWLADTKQISKEKLVAINKEQEIGWFVSDFFLSLGFLGTIWGIKEMVPEFANLDMSNIATKQAFLLKIVGGLGIALYTTLVGLACASLLKIQYFNLSQTVDYLDEDKEEEELSL